jgi:hypothetical protein
MGKTDENLRNAIIYESLSSPNIKVAYILK